MKEFLTEYEKEGSLYAGENITANSWCDAEHIAKKRTSKEKVVGYITK